MGAEKLKGLVRAQALFHLTFPAILVLDACASIAASPGPRWDALDEPGNLGRVEAVSISPYDPKRILAGGDVLGVGLSTNGGISWEQTAGITECYEINDFTFDPAHSNIVWVGTLSGPYKSSDGGRTWTLKRAGMPPLSHATITAPIQKVLFAPSDPNMLLALAGNHRHMGYGVAGKTCWGGVWKSIDAGEHWTKLTTIDDAAVGAPTDGTGVLINDAGFAAGSSSIVYACSDQGGVYKSTDGGTNFSKANDGLPNTEAWALALHPTNPQVLWVGLGRSGGIYQSTDGAKTWRRCSQGIVTDTGKRTEFRTIAVARSDPNCLYCASWTKPANAYRSTDGGATWETIINKGSKSTLVGGTGNPSILAFQWLSVDPANPAHVAGACEGNVVQSFDSGSSWRDVTCVAAGRNWRGTGYGGLCCTAIAWNPFRPGQVFTLGMDGGKLLRSDDSLWSWKLADPGLIGPFNSGNDVSFAADGTIYVAPGQFGNTAGPYKNEPIIKSTNWGASWAYTSRPAGAVGDNKAVYVNPLNSLQLWAIMGNVLYRSSDGGGTWVPLDLENSGHLWNLVAGPGHPGTLYVGAQAGVFESADGVHFRLMPGSPTSSNFEYVYRGPGSAGRLYAVSFNSGSLGGVYEHEHNRWRRIFKKPEVRALAVDPGNPQRLAVITKWWPARDLSEADGVWITADGGANWTQCNENLRMLRGSAIAFNPDKSGQLIAGTDGAGFFVTDLSASRPSVNPIPAVPGTIQARNYDAGGQEIAYHCKSGPRFSVESFRSEAANAGSTASTPEVCNLQAGDWLKYTVNVGQAATYDVAFRGASPGGRGRFHLLANGVNVTGPVAANGSGQWTEIAVHTVRLSAGIQHLTLCIDEAGADFESIHFAPAN